MFFYIRQKRWLQVLFILLLLPLFPESLRNQNKTYFDSMNWEELNDLAIPPLPEAYTIQESQPVPYADSIDDECILPSLSQLGILDYQNIPEDILSFCDTLSGALTARLIPESLFSKQKNFLPHLGRFIIERLPVISHSFYGRPVFAQNGSAQILFRLSVTPQEVQTDTLQPVATPAALEFAGETPKEAYNDPHEQETAQESAETTQKQGAAPEPLSPADTAAGSTQTAEISQQHESDISALFSETDAPLAIMLEITAIKEEEEWKISGIEVKGAEYADSALKD